MGNRLGVYGGQVENGDGTNLAEPVVDGDNATQEPLIEDIPDVNADTPSQELDNIISMIISKYEAVISSGKLVDGNLATMPELRRRNQQLQGTLARIIQILKEKQKVTQNQSKHNEALQHQVDSLKDVIAITRDLLNIRNMEVDHLNEDMKLLQEKITLERQRQTEVTEKMENASRLNDSLKAEYQKQMDLFSKLRNKYEERQDALTRENALLEKQLDIARNIVNSAQNSGTTTVSQANNEQSTIPSSPLIISPPPTTNNNNNVTENATTNSTTLPATQETSTTESNKDSSKETQNGGNTFVPEANKSTTPKENEAKKSPSTPQVDARKESNKTTPKEGAKGSSVYPKGQSKSVAPKDGSGDTPKEEEEDEEDGTAVSVVLKSVDNVLRLETSGSVEREVEETSIIDSD